MKITRRDFSRKVAYYLDLIEQGEVIEVGDLQLCKLNTHNNGELNNANQREIEKEVVIKKIEDVRHEDPKPGALVMVHKWRVEPDCFADEKYDWVPYPAHLVVKGVETRPYIEEEKIEPPMYALGLSLNNRATTMNDGGNPIPKPVKKKK